MKWDGHLKSKLAEVSSQESASVEEKTAQLRLMCELAEGRKSGELDGWISSEDVRKHFRVRTNAK